MQVKQIIGLVVLIVGVFFIGYGFYLRNNVAGATTEIQSLGKSTNPIVKTAGKDIQVKIGRYSEKVKWCLFGGGFLVIVGGGVVFFCRKKHHHRS